MNTWKENCVAHVVIRFKERFEEEVLASVLSAKKTGIKVGNGKGWREIYKVKYMPKTKSVFVVWDMALECAVTVFPAEWWDRKIKEYGL